MDGSIIFSDIRIAYTIKGSGPVLVLLHGYTENRSIWNDFSDSLCRNYSVVTVDLPGHGESDYYENLSVEFMAEALKVILDELGISTAAVVGHSMGGFVALNFAEKYPANTSGIGLFHSSARADSPEKKEYRLKVIDVINKNHMGFLHSFIPSIFCQVNVAKFANEIEILQKQASSMEARSLVAAQKAMINRSGSLELLTQTNVPVLFIIGKRDPIADIGKAIAQSTLPQKAFVTLIENCGHVGFIEAPNECLAALKGFLWACYSK